MKVDFDRALDLVREKTSPLATQTLAISDAIGSVLSENAIARVSHPQFNMSAMDGFVLNAAHCALATPANPVRLPILGAAYAGHALNFPDAVAAHAITTGSPIPERCDTVMVSERARVSDDGRHLFLDGPLTPGANVRLEGEDGLAGELLLAAGARLNSARIGALACYGLTHVRVSRTPRIAVLSTGDELALPSAAAIFDSNGPMITAQAREAGAEVWSGPVLRDSESAAVESLRQLDEKACYDIVVTSGGVSIGDRDCIPGALVKLGAKIWFHGVAMRPGKPVLFATLPNGTLFFGLPGNPVAAFLGFRFFVTAALRRLVGMRPELGRPIDCDLKPRPAMTVFLKARHETNGALNILPDQQSHRVRPLINANAWVAVDCGEGCAAQARLFPLTSPHES